MNRLAVRFVALVAAGSVMLPAAAVTAPAAVKNIGVTEHLNQQVPKELVFKDQTGKTVHLGDYFDGKHPVVLVLAYFECPMLCGLVLKSLANTLPKLGWAPGKQYKIVTVSFDPRDGPAQADKKRNMILGETGFKVPKGEWPFLTGTAENINPLLKVIGDKITQDPKTGMFAHAAVIEVLTPEGKISRYLYGVNYPVRNLKLALLKASQGKTGNAFDRFLMCCYHYNPATRSYGGFLTSFLQIGGAGIGLTVGGLLLVLWGAERKRRRARL